MAHKATTKLVFHPPNQDLSTGKTCAQYISRDVHALGDCVSSSKQDGAPLLLLKFVPPPPALLLLKFAPPPPALLLLKFAPPPPPALLLLKLPPQPPPALLLLKFVPLPPALLLLKFVPPPPPLLLLKLPPPPPPLLLLKFWPAERQSAFSASLSHHCTLNTMKQKLG